MLVAFWAAEIQTFLYCDVQLTLKNFQDVWQSAGTSFQEKSRVLEVPVSGALDSKIRATHFISFLLKNTFFPYSGSSPLTQVCLKLQSVLQPFPICVSSSIFLPQTVLQKFISLFSLAFLWLS